MLKAVQEKIGWLKSKLNPANIKHVIAFLSGYWLLSMRYLRNIWVGNCIQQNDNFGYIISIGFNGNDAMCVVAKVFDPLDDNRNRRVEVIDIPLYEITSSVGMVMNCIKDCLKKYPNAKVIFRRNHTSPQTTLVHHLQKAGIEFISIGDILPCMSENLRSKYVNQYSQGFWDLARAIKDNRFKIVLNARSLKQHIDTGLSHMSYELDGALRYKVLRKPEIIFKHVQNDVFELATCFALCYVKQVSYSSKNNIG